MYSLKIKIARSEDSVGPSDTDPFERKARGLYVDRLRLYKSGKTHRRGHLVSWTPVGPLPRAPEGKPGVPTASLQEETEGQVCAARNVAGGWCHVPECGDYLEDRGQGGPENLQQALSVGLRTLFQARPWRRAARKSSCGHGTRRRDCLPPSWVQHAHGAVTKLTLKDHEAL